MSFEVGGYYAHRVLGSDERYLFLIEEINGAGVIKGKIRLGSGARWRDWTIEGDPGAYLEGLTRDEIDRWRPVMQDGPHGWRGGTRGDVVRPSDLRGLLSDIRTHLRCVSYDSPEDAARGKELLTRVESYLKD